jgi:IclR family transcriptional regulator, KDG regulon repressor
MARPLSNERVQGIDRWVELIETLADEPRSLAAICRATGLAKGTAFRQLAGLAARGIVMKDPIGSTYTLGPAMLRLATAALSSVGSLVALDRSALEELSEETGETVALHVRSGLERVSVDEVPSRHSIRYTSLVGAVAPLHVGASGCVLLAFMPDDQRDRSLTLLAAAVRDLDRQALEERLRMARRDGWAVSLGARLPGASAISVPVQSDPLLLSLSVVGPSSRLPAARLEGFLPPMRRAASRVAAALAAHTGTAQAPGCP